MAVAARVLLQPGAVDRLRHADDLAHRHHHRADRAGVQGQGGDQAVAFVLAEQAVPA
jgi:hypothetical protein